MGLLSARLSSKNRPLGGRQIQASQALSVGQELRAVQAAKCLEVISLGVLLSDSLAARSFTPPYIRNPFGRRSHLARRSGGVLAVLQMRCAPRLCRDHPWKDEKRRVASRSPSTSLFPPLTLRDFKNAALALCLWLVLTRRFKFFGFFNSPYASKTCE